MSRFRPIDRKTAYLLPPSVEDWLTEDNLARFIVEAMEKLDLNDLARPDDVIYLPRPRLLQHIGQGILDVEEWDAEFFGPDSMWLRQWPQFACIRARNGLPGRDCEETWLGRHSADEEGDRFAWQGCEVARGTCDRGSRVGDQASQQADDEVAQAGEHLGSWFWRRSRTARPHRPGDETGR